MTVQLVALCFAAHDSLGLARFWAGVLGWETTHDDAHDCVALLPSDDTGFRMPNAPACRSSTSTRPTRPRSARDVIA